MITEIQQPRRLSQEMSPREVFKANQIVNQFIQLRRQTHISDPCAEFKVHGKHLKYSERALCGLDQENCLRKMAVWVIEWKWFERFILVVILVNTTLLAMNDYSYRKFQSQAPLTWRDQADYFFTGVFVFEFVMKITAMGFVMQPYSYLRDGWNLIDFVVVCTSCLSFFVTAKISAVRVVRILRPLRALNSLKGMKILVQTLLDALPALGNVMVFLIFIITLFGILGLQLFMGSLESKCRTTEKPINGKWQMLNETILCQFNSQCPIGSYCGNPLQYGLPYQDIADESINFGYSNFDNILWATFTIFTALTTEGWTQLISIYSQVQYPAIVYTYFILLIFMGAFFVVNLILAVINESFLNSSDEQKEQNHQKQLEMKPFVKQLPEREMSTDEQNSNYQSLSKLPSLPNFKLGCREYLQLFLESKFFQISITCTIIANTVVLAMDRYPQSSQEKGVLNVFNQFFTVIFCIEMMLKILSYRGGYIRDGANLFDALIVVLSMAEWVIDNSSEARTKSGSFTAIQAFRTLRLFRLFKLARTWKAFRKLLNAIGETLYGITNFMILLLLFMIISALLGMELFAYRIEYRYTYDTFAEAMLSVFLLLTNESWNNITYIFMHSADSIYPMFYFIFVVTVGNFILLKLFIAILIFNFAEASREINHQQDGSSEQIMDSSKAILKSIQKRTIFNTNMPILLDGTSLCLFGQENWIRMKITQLIKHKCFDYFILATIVFSSILLAIDDPMTDVTYPALIKLDVAITIVFIVEAVLKIISMGLIFNGRHSYMRSLANLLDLTVIIISSLTLDPNASSQLNKVKILRVIRVLRPLRLIVRNEELKMAINALFNSLAQIFNITVVCMIFFLLFGIFGVNQFKGALYSCDLEADNKWECFDKGGSWTNADYNFDNIANAMILLFTMATTEGWIDQMSHGIDHRGINLNPIINNNLTWSLYYVAFIVVGSFFMINLFAGVIVDAFAEEKDKLIGNHYMSRDELEWVSIQLKLYAMKAIKKFIVPKGFVKNLYHIVRSQQFEIFILICIILNTVVLTLQFNRQPSIMTTSIQILNWIFLAIFTIESILKLLVYKMHYFDSGWNAFDFTVVMLTLIGVILEQSNILSNVGTATSMLRTFRIFRVLRLVKSAKNLRVIFQTFLVTLPGLVSVGGLLLIMLYIFAIIFMNLYPFTKWTVGLSEFFNFTGFGPSLYLLFRSSTGENWNDVLSDLSRQSEPNNVCFNINDVDGYHKYGLMGCGVWHASVVYVIYMIVVSLIMLNLFVAVILEGFENSSEEENCPIKKQHIEEFQTQWQQFDKKATYFISCFAFSQFMCFLPQPLGVTDLFYKKWLKQGMSARQMRMATMKLHIPIYLHNGKQFYYYYDVLHTLSEAYIRSEQHQFNPNINSPQLLNQVQEARRAAYQRVSKMNQLFDSSHFVAACLIHRVYKNRAEFRRLRAQLI